MKKCSKCGKENIDEARFCTWCRAELPVTVEKKKNDTGRILAIVILIVAICACLVGVFMLFKDENSGNNQGENIAQKEGSSQADNDIPAEKKISGVYLAPFMNEEGKWGYINTDGEVVIECKYDLAYEFDEEGYAVVGMETDSDASEYYTICGLINAKGEEIIPLDYNYINSSIDSFCDSYGYRTITRLPYPLDYDDQYTGVIDKNGNIMISPVYSNISNIGDSGYYVACDAETGLCGIIDEDYKGKDLLLVGVLKGSVVFISELLKRLHNPCEIDFMAISTYGKESKSSGVVKILKDLDRSIEGKEVLIVEDIVDSGITLKYLMSYLSSKGASSVEIVTLLNKSARRAVNVNVKYIGFEAPDGFLVGYGLDYAEKYRNLPFIGILKEEIYS